MKLRRKLTLLNGLLRWVLRRFGDLVTHQSRLACLRGNFHSRDLWRHWVGNQWVLNTWTQICIEICSKNNFEIAFQRKLIGYKWGHWHTGKIAINPFYFNLSRDVLLFFWHTLKPELIKQGVTWINLCSKESRRFEICGPLDDVFLKFIFSSHIKLFQEKLFSHGFSEASSPVMLFILLFLYNG